MDRNIAFFSKPPNDGGSDPPVSQLHKARFPFGKGAVLDGKLTSSSCCTCTYLQLFNAIPRLAKKRVRISSFDPVYPKPKGRETSRAPKRAEICDSCTVLQLLRLVKRPKLTPLCSPRAVWTPPRGVSTSIFGDSLQEFIQKSETVDMWTSVCLIILKATTVHSPGGGSRAKASQLILTFCCRPPHWGEPFHCPRQGVPYKTCGPVSPKKKEEGGRGAKVARGQHEKRRSSQREDDGGGILEEAFPAKWNLWTATL